MKFISFCIPCYNEEKNVNIVYENIRKEMEKLKKYQYEIIFADNASKDKTPDVLKRIASSDKHVKVILNQANYGLMRSQRNCVFHATGDAVISLNCDLQEPTELIPQFIKQWEEGYKVVWGQKTKSQEKKIMYWMRSLYYVIINEFSNQEQLYQVTGFGLMDREVVNYIKEMDEIEVPARNLIPELGYEVKLIPYTQLARRNGKSSFNFYKYFNLAMHSLIYTSQVPLRLATFWGIIMGGTSFFIGLAYLIYKLFNWHNFQVGMAPVLIGVFFLGGVQLVFIGIVGEYVGVVLEKLKKRPLVIEKEIINFDNKNE